MRTQRAAFILARMSPRHKPEGIQEGRVERCSPFLGLSVSSPGHAREDGEIGQTWLAIKGNSVEISWDWTHPRRQPLEGGLPVPFVPRTRTGGRDVAEGAHGGSVQRDRAAAGGRSGRAGDHAGAEVLATPGAADPGRSARAAGSAEEHGRSALDGAGELAGDRPRSRARTSAEVPVGGEGAGPDDLLQL